MSGRSWALKAARISTGDDGEADRPDDDRVALAERHVLIPRSHLSEPVLYCTGTVRPATVTLPWNWQR